MEVKENDIAVMKAAKALRDELIEKTTQLVAESDIADLQALKEGCGATSDAEFVGILRMVMLSSEEGMAYQLFSMAADYAWFGFEPRGPDHCPERREAFKVRHMLHPSMGIRGACGPSIRGIEAIKDMSLEERKELFGALWWVLGDEDVRDII